MKILLLLTGKTDKNWIQQGIDEYFQRISKYIHFEIITVALPKQYNSNNIPFNKIKSVEAEKQLKIIRTDDYVVALDEHGKSCKSKDFAKFIENRTLSGNKRVVFVIGGAYGLCKTIIERSDFQLSLSAMTFSHQIVRLLFMEQLYRAFTIIKNEPYHHE